jgi:hypothetical protein
MGRLPDGRMSDEDIQKAFDDYNRLRARESYWVGAGMALVEYLHKNHGMRYAEIYAIAESQEWTKAAKAALAVIRMENNVTEIRLKNAQ